MSLRRASLFVFVLSACATSRPDDQPLDPNGAAGGGGSESTPDASASDAAVVDEPICDGSADMRLAVTAGGGFVPSTFAFTNPYGHRFLFVDGQCRYYASVDYMKGVATGTLDAAQAQQLASDVGWSMLERWSAYHDVQCPDAGATAITRPSSAATCICGCQDMGPPGLADAMNKAGTWLQDLHAQGKPAAGAVSAIAAPAAATGRELAWSLARPIASIAGFVGDSERGVVGPGVRFDDPADAQALRELRDAALAQMMYAQSIPVLDEGTAYTVFARDDLPDSAGAAIDALLSSAAEP